MPILGVNFPERVFNLARTLWFGRLRCDRNYYGAAVCLI